MASSFLPSCLSPALGAGRACFGLAAPRRIDPGVKALGAALCVLAFSANPAQADQFVEAADNARIDCVLSRGELTRIALVGDGFANVSKIASAYGRCAAGTYHGAEDRAEVLPRAGAFVRGGRRNRSDRSGRNGHRGGLHLSPTCHFVSGFHCPLSHAWPEEPRHGCR